MEGKRWPAPLKTPRQMQLFPGRANSITIIFSTVRYSLNESLRAFPHGLLASVAAFVTPAGRDRCERLTSVGEDNGCARCRLIAPDDDVDVERIELDAIAHPPGILGGD